MATITVFWFSYAGDAEMLPWSIKSVRQFIPEARLVVVDDCHQASDSHTRQLCREMGVDWLESAFDRKGNLWGNECIDGILAHYVMAANEGADIIIKMDPDTLLLGREWLDGYLKTGCGLCGMDDRNGYVYGMCYALTAGTARELQQSYLAHPQPLTIGEDVAIGSRARYLFTDWCFHRVPLWRKTDDNQGNGPHGIATTWLWTEQQIPQDKINQYARQFQIVTVGNKFPKDYDPALKAQVMQKLHHASTAPKG